MKTIIILLAIISLSLCSTVSAGQGGGGESTKTGSSKKGVAKKKASGTTSTNTTPARPPASPARATTPTGASLSKSPGPSTPEEWRLAKVASQTPTKEIGKYRYMPDEKADGKIHNPLERRPQLFGTITLTDVGITASGEQPGGNPQPERCNFFDSLAVTLGRSNTKEAISWNDSRNLFSVNGYGCHLQFETQQERDRFFVDFARTFQEWKAKYAGFQFAAGKLTVTWPCTRGQEAAPCADSTLSTEKPVWQTQAYKVTVESLERIANRYIATLVFENLTNDVIKIGWEEKTNLLAAAGPYLIDENGYKYFVDGTDSEKIITSSMVMAGKPVEIPVKVKLTSRFVFSGSGDGKIFNLEAKTIDWPGGVPITIEGLRVTSPSNVIPDPSGGAAAPATLDEADSGNRLGAIREELYRKFVGGWKNVDGNTGGITRIEIRSGAKSMQIHMWGKCHPEDCDWGEVSIPLADADNRTISIRWSHFDGRLVSTQQFDLLPDGRLRVITHTHFSDGSGRPDYDSTDYFSRN
jgi:hypothetical protein